MRKKKRTSYREEIVAEIEKVHHVFVFRDWEYMRIKILIYICHILIYGRI